MKHETQTSSSAELTRKQKLARRFMPVALLAAGGAIVAGGQLKADKEPIESHFEVQSSATAVGVFGSEDSDWGHGLAEHLIKKAVLNATAHAYAELESHNVGQADEHVDIEKLVDELPVYDQANEALEMAGYTEITPDVGDELTINVEVTAEEINGTKHIVTYEVVDASINDLPNNQQ